ncbi:uridine diphosphate glucose pyrophosphatase NUDT14-like isoform X2 [Oppia nitens]|uniref:uridine diphosphate glucose pyrophosphatase NUDT14-like isoform X2 n=1 Tax=Oppia nitens TaxID=1686743 RepID=UPI0023DBB719|nr:uridine diphosphate glucose pyrophosphatase NUDT14-like isoform X2 [Oppia nitens]
MATNDNKDVIELESIEVLEANQSQYLKPHRLHYKLNGRPLIWDLMKVHDSVSIVLYNRSTNRLIFVRQFRPAVFFAFVCKSVDSIDLNMFSKDNINQFNELLVKNKNLGFTIELCAGKTIKEIAKEEVEEETGYLVDTNCLQFISSFRSGVGISGSLQHLYYCEVTCETPKGKGGGVDGEQIEVLELTIDEAKKLLYCGDSEAMMSRPAGLLFGLSWFLYQHLPTLS